MSRSDPEEDKPLLSSLSDQVKLYNIQHVNSGAAHKPKTYKTRWLVLSVFFFHLLYVNLAWSNMDSIADLAKCYYNVNLFWINSLAYVYSFMYVFIFAFATWFLGRFGLQWAAIVSGCLGAVGAWLKFAAVGNDYFFLLLFGQSFIAFQNVIEWSAPALLSAVWFPPHERAIATALVGAVAPQAGVLISLSLGPIIFNHWKISAVCEDNFSYAVDLKASMYYRLLYYLLGQAVFATLLFPIAFLIPGAPPTPPSISKQVGNNLKKLTAYESVVSLLKNIHFMFFLLVFGILLSANAVYVIAFEEILHHSGYGQYEPYMTYIGFAMQILSILGLLAVGKWIDITKTFYGSSVVVCLVSTIIASGYAVVVQLKLHFYIVSALCTLTVIFVTVFQAVGYEFGVEMTFPVEEGTIVALLNAASRAFVILMIMAASAMIKKYAVYVLWFLAGALGVAFLIQIFIRPKLRRVELDSQSNNNHLYVEPQMTIQDE